MSDVRALKEFSDFSVHAYHLGNLIKNADYGSVGLGRVLASAFLGSPVMPGLLDLGSHSE